MKAANTQENQKLTDLLSAISSEKNLVLYALVDPAQDKRVIEVIADESLPNACFFDYPLDSPIANSTPRLVQIFDPLASPLMKWILNSAPDKPVATLIASKYSLDKLVEHLREQMDVQLQDLDSMFLAFWDPAILGTLVGQPEDLSLHVPGPVFTTEQASSFLLPIKNWFYWNRDGKLLDAVPGLLSADRESSKPFPVPKIIFSPEQVDMLVEASVPDHLLFHLQQNQPGLLQPLPDAACYRFVSQQMTKARGYGLDGTGDMVNYISVALEYGAEFDSLPFISPILKHVAEKQLTFDEAMRQFPEDQLLAQAQ